MFVQLNSDQRKALSDKLLSLGNIAIGSLIFGVVVSRELFRWWLAVLGLVIYTILTIVGLLLLKTIEGDNKQ